MNPYAPPEAELADLSAQETHFKDAPASTRLAVWLLLVSMGVGLVDLALAPVPAALWAAIAIDCIVVGFIFAMAKGKNWARVTFLLLFLLGLLGLVMMPEQLLQGGALSMAVMAIQSGLQLVAIVLLYLPGSNAWFRGKGQQG
ncbi:MAG: hypothetical protein RLZZ618_2654 [Pseudomonadota bacterium]|jgi:hypothetical protein